jgi:DNA-binding protein HU-beta
LEFTGWERNLFINLEGKKMAAAMTKSKILDTLSKKLEFSKKQMNEALSELVSLAYKEAKNSFTFPGLGKLVVVNRKARMGRNPQTGAAIKIPAKRVLKFRVAKACKDAVLGKK